MSSEAALRSEITALEDTLTEMLRRSTAAASARS